MAKTILITNIDRQNKRIQLDGNWYKLSTKAEKYLDDCQVGQEIRKKNIKFDPFGFITYIEPTTKVRKIPNYIAEEKITIRDALEVAKDIVIAGLRSNKIQNTEIAFKLLLDKAKQIFDEINLPDDRENIE